MFPSLSTSGGAIQGTTKPSASGFFGNVLSGISEGISKLGSDVMPNWVARTLGEQKENQLDDDMWDSVAAALRLSYPASTGGAIQEPLQTPKPVIDQILGLQIGDVNISGATVVTVVLVAIAGTFIYKAVT